MRLATHNTMTYQTPKQWWAKLVPFVAKCQNVDYKTQHELGAIGFDLRIFWDKNGNIEFRHGFYAYPADNLYEVLDYARDNDIMVRVLLELRDYNSGSVKDPEEMKNKFTSFCKEIEEKYPTIKFYGGKCTEYRDILYKFKNQPVMNEIGLYSSVTSLFTTENKLLRMIDDWCPWLYAKLMNKKNIEKYKSNDDKYVISLDFIEIQ